MIGLALERPWFGWGWVGYWQPWVEPFDGLAVRNGVEYLQAHNAWLDVWMQLGIVGLVAFASIVDRRAVALVVPGGRPAEWTTRAGRSPTRPPRSCRSCCSSPSSARASPRAAS